MHECTGSSQPTNHLYQLVHVTYSIFQATQIQATKSVMYGVLEVVRALISSRVVR
jgi:hypothetical protein